MAMALEVGVFGEYMEEVGKPLSQSLLVVNSQEMMRNWRTVSLSSDFFARYYSYYFPYREKAQERISRETAENIISFVLNELIENTAKYSNAEDQTVRIRVWLLEDDIIFSISNFVTHQLAESFAALAREILESNPEELYLKRLERNTQSEEGASGLGYLTLINDYGIALGFKFEPTDPDQVQVTVQARMKCKEA
jgi:hypothetical protein